MLSGQIVFQPKSEPHLNGFSPPVPPEVTSNVHKEASNDMVKQGIKGKQKVEDLLRRSNNVLLKVSTIFPFVLFPIDIVIDANKIDIVYRTFFFSEQIHSIFVKDITDVLVENAFWFGTLKIVDVGFTENSIDIPWLWKEDANRARRIIQGLVLAAKEGRDGTDLTHFNSIELAEKMEEIGQVKQVSEDSN